MKRILTVSTLEKRAMRKKVFKNRKEKYQETKTVSCEELHDLYLLLVRGHRVIKSRRVRWTMHISPMGEKSMQSSV